MTLTALEGEIIPGPELVRMNTRDKTLARKKCTGKMKTWRFQQGSPVAN